MRITGKGETDDLNQFDTNIETLSKSEVSSSLALCLLFSDLNKVSIERVLKINLLH